MQSSGRLSEHQDHGRNQVKLKREDQQIYPYEADEGSCEKQMAELEIIKEQFEKFEKLRVENSRKMAAEKTVRDNLNEEAEELDFVTANYQVPPTPGINLENLKNEDISSEDGGEEAKAADPLVSFGHELIEHADGSNSKKSE